jgi:hypothetical protein
MHIRIPTPLSWVLSEIFVVTAILASSTPMANAQFTYANTTTGAGLTVGTSEEGTTFTATPTMTGTATDGTLTAAGSSSGVFGNGDGSYSGTGSADLTYNLDPTGMVITSGLNGSADAVTPSDVDAVITTPSAGVGTDFMVGTTGEYNLTASVLFGGRASAQFGALFLTFTVNDDTNGGGLQLDDNYQDENPTPDSPAGLNEQVLLTAGDRYTLAFGTSLNPETTASSAPMDSSLTASAEVSITEVPEPASLSVLALMTFSLVARPARKLLQK